MYKVIAIVLIQRTQDNTMTDNNAKTITDKPITVRIPLDLLEAIENKASDRYPSRKGTGGNRSQVILDALVFYQSHQWGEGEDSLQSTQGTQEVIRDEVKKYLSDNVHDIIQETVHKELQGITGNLEYLIDKALEKRLQSTQSNNDVDTLQSVQSIISEDDNKIQRTQNNTENNSSENELEATLKNNQDINIIEETTSLETANSEKLPKKQIEQEIGDDEVEKAHSLADLSEIANNADKGLTDRELADLLAKQGKKTTASTVNRWRNGKTNPTGKNKNLFEEWEVRGDRWRRLG